MTFALIAIGTVSLNLRPATASLAPLVDVIGLELRLSHFVLGLLGTVPVLCMAVVPVAMLRLRRHRPDRSLQLSLLAIFLALALRVVASAAVVFASALLAGLGVSVIQAVLSGCFAIWTEGSPRRSSRWLYTWEHWRRSDLPESERHPVRIELISERARLV